MEYLEAVEKAVFAQAMGSSTPNFQACRLGLCMQFRLSAITT